ncbi:MAG: peptidase M3 [Acidobacteria bacterium]|nr:peptidase M3 [Acidobacteriota bacterium]
MSLAESRAFFDTLNHDYVAVHKAKEDLFWSTYMAISSDDEGFARAERAYKDFIADPEKLQATRAHLGALEALPPGEERDALVHGLRGWQALFEAHIIESAEGRRLMHEIVEAEAALFAKRRTYSPRHVNDRGEEEDATLSMLATNLATNPREERRRSSFDGFRALEQWVLDNGFLEIVALRNRFARALGYPNYFEFKLRKNERMTPAVLFAMLDDFTARTEAANARTLSDVRARHGEDAVAPWNLRYFTTGDVVRQMDEYLSFGLSLRRWVESFRRLHITFRGATLQLDLLERPGKYQNGFCHSPLPARRNERGEWVASQINFTSEAKPDQVGSGIRAINTLFHEGGHAAHFANVVQNAPCFSQEYAPTSMAYAETQSMFCDSILNDGDWLARYARNRTGDAMPPDLIRARVATRQPMMAFDNRSIAVVPYFEAALYAMDDSARTPEAVLALARETERRVLGVESPRPLLAIPHLLNQESAAAYQGYLLAQMAVSQTRAFFLRRDGYLTDNPGIGPALAAHYWEPGNSVSHDDTLRSLTGEGFSARYLADECNRSVDEAWAEAQRAIDAAAARGPAGEGTPSLDARIRIVHGAELIADSTEGEDAMCTQFETWVAERYSR